MTSLPTALLFHWRSHAHRHFFIRNLHEILILRVKHRGGFFIDVIFQVQSCGFPKHFNLKNAKIIKVNLKICYRYFG